MVIKPSLYLLTSVGTDYFVKGYVGVPVAGLPIALALQMESFLRARMDAGEAEFAFSAE